MLSIFGNQLKEKKDAVIPRTPRISKFALFDPEKPGAFRGPLQLWRQVKKENKYKVGLIKIRQWLQHQDVYSMNKAVRRRFKKARVFTGGIKDQYDADLMDVGFHAKENEDIKYPLR